MPCSLRVAAIRSAPEAEVAVPMTTAPRRPSSRAMAWPMPRLAPVTSATLPCRLMQASPDSGPCRARGGEGIRGIEVGRVDAIGATLVQAGQHLARAAFDQFGSTVGRQALDRLDPTYWLVKLFQQVALEGHEVSGHLGTDVLHQRDLRCLPVDGGNRFGKALGGRAHQFAMRRYADRQRQGALGTLGLAGFHGALD